MKVRKRELQGRRVFCEGRNRTIQDEEFMGSQWEGHFDGNWVEREEVDLVRRRRQVFREPCVKVRLSRP